jgi:hypothetical protein
MPIKPENKHRYPPDWPDIRKRILARAHHRCEHPGCLAVHRQLGFWRDGSWVRLPRALRDAGISKPTTLPCEDGTTIKVIMIVLTIAHLDHTPENCADDNLRAWCQRHHLAYDAEHHARTAYETRRKGMAIADLFEVDWQISDIERKAHELAQRYHRETEFYDRIVCTGPIRHGAIMPASPQESALVTANAIKTRTRLMAEADMHGIPRQVLLNAIKREA